MPPQHLVWIDMESTGLDPQQHVMLEIAVVVTNFGLKPVSPGLEIVIAASDVELSRMNDLVRTMHTRSGLLDRVRSSGVPLAKAQLLVIQYLLEWAVPPEALDDDREDLHSQAMAERPRLAGNSVHADRKFLEVHMPRATALLHYRNVDVSSFKETAAIYRPEIYEGRPSKRETHRALDDILESIAEYRYYLEHLLGISI